MMFKQVALLALAMASVDAFTAPQPARIAGALQSSLTPVMEEEPLLLRYSPGKAEGELGQRFGDLAGKDIKTVGEAFCTFTDNLGFSVNALYKNTVTDIVGTTHLITVGARFKRDPIWSLGLVVSLNVLLKNYPERDVADKIEESLFKAVDLDEAEIRAEAQTILDAVKDMSREDVEAALSGEGSSPIAAIANAAKADNYWQYSRYFGVGLVKVMEEVGIEMDKDVVYPIMETWMKEKMEKKSQLACNDSDFYFKVKAKLDLMETMMKEIEIREKKKMAERLEEKAELALKAAERESKMQAEIDAGNM